MANTKQKPLEVASWANDNYKRVMAQKTRMQARKTQRTKRIKDILWKIWFIIMVCIIIIMLMMWLKNGYVIQW